jgi:hypothetical protein
MELMELDKNTTGRCFVFFSFPPQKKSNKSDQNRTKAVQLRDDNHGGDIVTNGRTLLLECYCEELR